MSVQVIYWTPPSDFVARARAYVEQTGLPLLPREDRPRRLGGSLVFKRWRGQFVLHDDDPQETVVHARTDHFSYSNYDRAAGRMLRFAPVEFIDPDTGESIGRLQMVIQPDDRDRYTAVVSSALAASCLVEFLRTNGEDWGFRLAA
jgi:hypothetical protein